MWRTPRLRSRRPSGEARGAPMVKVRLDTLALSLSRQARRPAAWRSQERSETMSVLSGRSRLTLTLASLLLTLPLIASVAGAQGKPKIEVIASIGHVGYVSAVAFSPDGSRVLSGAAYPDT